MRIPEGSVPKQKFELDRDASRGVYPRKLVKPRSDCSSRDTKVTQLALRLIGLFYAFFLVSASAGMSIVAGSRMHLGFINLMFSTNDKHTLFPGFFSPNKCGE